MSNTSVIISTEIESKLDKTKTIEENFRTAVTAVKSHWLAPNEKEAFDAVVMAVSSLYGIDSPEFERIKEEMKIVNAFYMTPSNVPVDLGMVLANAADTNYKPIGFIKIWKQVYQK